MIWSDSTYTAHLWFPSLPIPPLSRQPPAWFFCIWAKEISFHSSFLTSVVLTCNGVFSGEESPEKNFHLTTDCIYMYYFSQNFKLVSFNRMADNISL